MQGLTEERTKELLRDRGLPVPDGRSAATAEQAAEIVGGWGESVVKALVATGRRGKAGAVRFAASPEEAREAARQILGRDVGGHLARAVYVERRVSIAQELYLAFIAEDYPPHVLVSTRGGVDIEETHATHATAIVRTPIDPLRGLPSWDAIDLWERAGLNARLLPVVAQVTGELYDAFVAAEATMLEINPLAIDPEGRPYVVGAMMATEDLLFQEDEATHQALGAGHAVSERERRVIEANRRLPGGMVRYTELDGNIGMFVGGGGAGLHQHDLILAAGGRPANHTDASTVNSDKVRVLIDAILDNPRVQSLFVSWHYQQMARIERRVIPVVQALKERNVDLTRFPVVMRMFGPGEDEARAAAAELPNIHYLPHGAPMEEGVRLIVRLTEQAAAGGVS